jgi:hypothetical protein
MVYCLMADNSCQIYNSSRELTKTIYPPPSAHKVVGVAFIGDSAYMLQQNGQVSIYTLNCTEKAGTVQMTHVLRSTHQAGNYQTQPFTDVTGEPLDDHINVMAMVEDYPVPEYDCDWPRPLTQ